MPKPKCNEAVAPAMPSLAKNPNQWHKNRRIVTKAPSSDNLTPSFYPIGGGSKKFLQTDRPGPQWSATILRCEKANRSWMPPAPYRFNDD
jgi:hypothetical protein